jgi:multiple sugar transport system permease protein
VVRPHRALRRAAFYLLLLATLGFLVFPFAWMFTGSFKTQAEFMAYPPRWVFTPTLANYEKVFVRGDFLKFTVNSLVIALGSTTMSLLLGVPAAYSIARYRQTRLGMVLLTARMAPGIAFLIPWFILFSKLRIIDTYPAVMLTHMVVVLPLVIWVLVGFFEEVPRELEEAALIDGASRLYIFYGIILPLARPAIAVTALFCFMTAWNEYILAATFLGQETSYTLPVLIKSYVGEFGSTQWGSFAAGAVIVSIPVVGLFYALQRHLVAGLTSGSVKG